VTRQLVLSWPVRAARGRGDFVVSAANARALAALDADDWPGGRMVLAGPPGAGKTHLAHVWAGDSSADVVAAQALTEGDVAVRAAAGAVAVEDADLIAGDPEAERALLHLLNLLAERGGRTLVTATAPPRDWGLTLPDLVSRLQAAGLIRLTEPDDALLQAVIAKQFADRGLAVAPEHIAWAVARMERSFAAAKALVAAVDARSMAAGRAVSRATVAGALAALDGGDPEAL
jgi:chromosomal replication initiation ATPase DnaA